MTRKLESLISRQKPTLMRAHAHDQRVGRKEPMSRKLLPDERRAIVMAALQYGSNKSEIARRFNISRGRLYQLLDDAMTDPKGKLREAEKDVQFRREVLRLTR
jgi:transposase-like protein